MQSHSCGENQWHDLAIWSMDTWYRIYTGYCHHHDIQCREVLSLQVPEFRAIEMPEVVAGFALFEESKHTPSTICKNSWSGERQKGVWLAWQTAGGNQALMGLSFMFRPHNNCCTCCEVGLTWVLWWYRFYVRRKNVEVLIVWMDPKSYHGNHYSKLPGMFVPQFGPTNARQVKVIRRPSQADRWWTRSLEVTGKIPKSNTGYTTITTYTTWHNMNINTIPFNQYIGKWWP